MDTVVENSRLYLSGLRALLLPDRAAPVYITPEIAMKRYPLVKKGALIEHDPPLHTIGADTSGIGQTPGPCIQRPTFGNLLPGRLAVDNRRIGRRAGHPRRPADGGAHQRQNLCSSPGPVCCADSARCPHLSCKPGSSGPGIFHIMMRCDCLFFNEHGELRLNVNGKKMARAAVGSTCPAGHPLFIIFRKL
jgi:hypothetical protein